MLKRVIDHVQGITFDVEYSIELNDATETLSFKCYSPDGVRHKWVLHKVDTDSYMGTDHDFELRHFALAVFEIDGMPVTKYLHDEMGVTLPDILEDLSDSPHEWVWSTDDRQNQVMAVANLVYTTVGKLPFEIQEALTKIFRAEHSRALGVSHIADEFNRMDDILKLMEFQAQELAAKQPNATAQPETETPAASELNPAQAQESSAAPKAKKKVQNESKDTQTNEGANDDRSRFVPPHKSTREYELTKKMEQRDEEKKELPPQVLAAMEYTEKSYK